MSDLRKEIEKRRTFAIISHPDAGKTTLTEKFLLLYQYSGYPGTSGFLGGYLPYTYGGGFRSHGD